MGGFYGSVHLWTDDRPRVLAAAGAVAAERGIKCLVGPALNGWVGVYPEGSGQDDTVGQQIAERVGGYAVHLLVHDDDILAYWLWSDGKLVDRYHSSPGYFGQENLAEEEPLVGDAKRFAFLLDSAGQAKLAGLLDRDAKEAFEVERLRRLGRLLGIENVVASYEYLDAGEAAGIKQRKNFVEVPQGARQAEADRQKANRDQLKARKAALKRSGKLLFSEVPKDAALQVVTTSEGFAVFRFNPTGGKDLQRFLPPWKKALFAAETPIAVFGLRQGRSPDEIALLRQGETQFWRLANGAWTHERSVAQSPAGVRSYSPDGSALAVVGGNEVDVTRTDNLERLFNVQLTGVRHVQFHPGGDWLVASGDTVGLISMNSEPRTRPLLVGGRNPLAEEMEKKAQANRRSVDMEKIVAEMRPKLELRFENFKRLVGQSPNLAGSLADLKRAQERGEEDLSKLRAELVARRDGSGRIFPPKGLEAGRIAGFTRDGKWLWVGTDFGIRVYDFLSVPRDGGVLPPPVWSFNLTPNPSQRMWSAGLVVRSVAEEPGSAAIVFGGDTGRVYRLNLKTGEIRELLSLPEPGVIAELHLSTDGTALGIVSSVPPATKYQLGRWKISWEIWSYPRLVETSQP